MWQFRTQEEIKTTHEYPVGIAKFNAEFESIVSCDDSGMVYVWDAENGKLLSKFEAFSGNKITAATFDETKWRLITGSSEGEIRIWNFSNG